MSNRKKQFNMMLIFFSPFYSAMKSILAWPVDWTCVRETYVSGSLLTTSVHFQLGTFRMTVVRVFWALT